MFLENFSGVTVYDLDAAPDCICLDASLNGLGGSYNNIVYAISIVFLLASEIIPLYI